MVLTRYLGLFFVLQGSGPEPYSAVRCPSDRLGNRLLGTDGSGGKTQQIHMGLPIFESTFPDYARMTRYPEVVAPLAGKNRRRTPSSAQSAPSENRVAAPR